MHPQRPNVQKRKVQFPKSAASPVGCSGVMVPVRRRGGDGTG